MSHTESFLRAFEIVVDMLPLANVDAIGEALVSLKQRKGRLFFLGVGGSAANASHAVNDFRKIAGIESYTPTDNIAELTARTNDDGWRYTFEAWLQTSRLSSNDAVFVLSVGGGTDATSPNLVNALAFAKKQQAVILGIVGRDGGATLAYAHVCVLVPTVDARRNTPYVESVQSLLLHLMVTNPALLA
jgi:D-sedoheptulose 7-phosphate isomerase